jgi:hypothetical protein
MSPFFRLAPWVDVACALRRPRTRWCQAQDLLDRRRDQLGLVDRHPPVLGMGGGVNMYELGTRGVQPGEDEHGQHVEHLGVGERAIVVGRVQEMRGEVAGRGSGS